MSLEHGGQPAGARGRPRSAAADRAILDAVLALVGEGHSVASLSIEAIAKRAGVGKATIYRRWSNLEALLIEAFATDHTVPDLALDLPMRECLVTVLETVAGYGQRTGSRVYAALQADAVGIPGFRDRYFSQVIEPRRELLRRLLRLGIERGELRPDIDLEAVREVLISPMLMYTRGGDFAGEMDPGLPRRIVDTVLKGIGTGRAARRSH